MPLLHGFDVYHGNGTPAFPWADMVQKYAITLGCCKVSQGTSFTDPTWQRNRYEMHRAGLRYVGMYHWLSPKVPLAKQLENFQRIGTLEPGEFVMLDVEDRGGLSVAACLDACATWEAAYPGRFIRYQGKYFAAGDTDAYAAWPWWLAYYGPSTVPPTHLPVTVWQWGGGTLGVEHYDSNQIISKSALEKISGYTGQYDPTHPPADDEDEMNLDGFVHDENNNVWARGVDAKGQWTQPVVAGDNPLNIAWELYNKPTAPAPLASLESHRRMPDYGFEVAPPAPPAPVIEIDYDLLANKVADVLAARMAS